MSVLVIGCRDSQLAGLKAALNGHPGAIFVEAGAAPEHCFRRLKDTPRCALVDVLDADVSEIVSFMRRSGDYFDTPVVAMAPSADDAVFRLALAHGADDVVLGSDATGIARRVAVLAAYEPKRRPAAVRGKVLIVSNRHEKRIVLGRALRHAGFDPVFADTIDECLDVSKLVEPELLLVDVLDESGQNQHQALLKIRPAILGVRSRAGKPKLPAVMISPSSLEDADRIAGVVSSLGHVAIADQASALDQILFFTNELLNEKLAEVRASARSLLTTLCTVRKAKSSDTLTAVTYNVSRGGLFIRTLDCPESGSTVDVTFTPPAAGALPITVHAKVVWKSSLVHGSAGASPPGFGVTVDVQATAPDPLARYLALCDELAKSRWIGVRRHGAVGGREAKPGQSARTQPALRAVGRAV